MIDSFLNFPDPLKLILVLLVVGVAAVFLVIIFNQAVAKPIINFIAKSKERDRHRVKEVSTFSWGNPILRAPLVSIGTDIYAFGQTSIHGKTIRYIKAASVYIPVAWSIFALTLLIKQSGHSSQELSLFILLVPISLVAATIFILDVSIITAKSIGSKAIRILIALITGYLFSAIPLDYIYSSDVSSYLLTNDSQIREVTTTIKNQISDIEKKTWYQDYLKEVNALSGISDQLEKERLGEGVTGVPNQTTKRNGMYEQIMFEYNMKREYLRHITDTHASEFSLLQNLNSRLTSTTQEISAANPSSHIKRHLALWSYAFSSFGTAMFFLCCLILFWTIDSLAVLVSFLDESEYLENVRLHNERRASVFASTEFQEKFKPVISDNTL